METCIVTDIANIIEKFKDNDSRAIAKVIYKEISSYGNCDKCDYLQLKQRIDEAVKYIVNNTKPSEVMLCGIQSATIFYGSTDKIKSILEKEV